MSDQLLAGLDCRTNDGWLADDLECGISADPRCLFHAYERTKVELATAEQRIEQFRLFLSLAYLSLRLMTEERDGAVAELAEARQAIAAELRGAADIIHKSHDMEGAATHSKFPRWLCLRCWQEKQAELERLRLESVEAGLLRAALGGLALRFGIEAEIERILGTIKADAARLLENWRSPID